MNLAAVKAGYERLKACASSDTCEYMGCAYFTRPDELTEVLSLLEETIAKAETCNSWQFEPEPGAGDRIGSGTAGTRHQEQTEK